MLFGKFYIKNYHANFNSYFSLKVKGLTGKNILYGGRRKYPFNEDDFRFKFWFLSSF